MSLAVSDEGLRPSARDEDLRRAEKHRLLPHCLYEILYQYTACAAVCQPRRAHFSKLFSLGLRHLPFVDRASCGALPPFVNRERCGASLPFVNRGALRRFTAVDKRERCGAAIQKRRIRPRFFAKKARARAKFGWYVLVAVRQKAALFEEAGDIV